MSALWYTIWMERFQGNLIWDWFPPPNHRHHLVIQDQRGLQGRLGLDDFPGQDYPLAWGELWNRFRREGAGYLGSLQYFPEPHPILWSGLNTNASKIVFSWELANCRFFGSGGASDKLHLKKRPCGPMLSWLKIFESEKRGVAWLILADIETHLDQFHPLRFYPYPLFAKSGRRKLWDV